ncbi:hypothetical protein CYMTET_27957, partial [Cymbomonas tetramitiformis]
MMRVFSVSPGRRKVHSAGRVRAATEVATGFAGRRLQKPWRDMGCGNTKMDASAVNIDKTPAPPARGSPQEPGHLLNIDKTPAPPAQGSPQDPGHPLNQPCSVLVFVSARISTNAFAMLDAVLDERSMNTRPPLGQVLGLRTKSQQRTAANRLREVCEAVEAVSRVAVVATMYPTRTVPPEVDQEAIIDLVDTLVDVARRLVNNPQRGARLVLLLQCSERLLMTVEALKPFPALSEETLVSWQGKLRAMRKTRAQVRVPEKQGVGMALVDMHLTRLEARLIHFPKEGQTVKVMAAGATMVFGLCKSLLMTRLDSTFVDGLKQAAGLASDAVRQGATHVCLAEMALADQLSILMGGLSASHVDADAHEDKDVDVQAVGRDTLQYLKHLQGRHFQLTKGRWEPTPGRWEPKAAFATLLGEVALGKADSAVNICSLPPEVLSSICMGDEQFIGLCNLMSLGASTADWATPCKPMALRLTHWVEELLYPGLDFAEWRGRGLQLLTEGVRLLTDDARARLDSAASELLVTSTQHLTSSVADRLEERGAELRENAAEQRDEARELLAGVGHAVDSLCAALQAVCAGAKAAQVWASKASKLLHTLAGCDASNSTTARAFAFLKHAAVQGVVTQLLGERSPPAEWNADAVRALAVEHLSSRLLETAESANLCGCMDAVLRALKSGTLQALKAGWDWEALSDAVPEVKVAVAQIQDVPQKMAHDLWSKADQGAAALAGFLSLVPVDSPDCQKLWDDEVRPALTACCRQAARDVPTFWRNQLQEACVKLAAGAASARHSASQAETLQDVKGAADGLQSRSLLKDAAEATARKMVDALLQQEESVGLERLASRLIAALEVVSCQLVDRDAANIGASVVPKAWTSKLPGLVEDLADHSSRLLRFLHDVESCAAKCKELLELHGEDPWECQAPEKSPTELLKVLAQRLRVVQAALVEDPLQAAFAAADPQPAEAAEERTASLMAAKMRACRAADVAQAQSAEAEVAAMQAAFARLVRNFGALGSLTEARLPDVDLKLVGGLRATIEEDLKAAGIDGLKSTIQNAANGMKVDAVELLDQAASTVVGEAAAGMAAGMAEWLPGDLLRDLARGYVAARPLEQRHVREAAAVSVLQVLDGLRAQVGAPRCGNAPSPHACDKGHDAATRRDAHAARAKRDALRDTLQAAVMRCWSLEVDPAVRAVLAGGDTLAAELNMLQRVVAWEEGDEETEAQAGGAHDERFEAWTAVQETVRQEVEGQLQALADLRQQAEREADVLRKHQLLLRCREVHAALARVSCNVKDQGTSLGVMIGFLTGIDSKLDAIGAQLDELQEGVRALGLDLRKLVGRPVLEELRERAERRCAEQRRLREQVYIPTRGLHAGEDGKFEVDTKPSERHEAGSNPPVDLLTAVRAEFLKSNEKKVLLVSGQAGSGKSTFVQELEHVLDMACLQERPGDGVETVLVKVSLPTLRNPLADLFGEALRQKGLREAQINELRDLVRDGRARLLLLLDAYDELPQQYLFKNLYMTNNLEQFRAQPAARGPGASGGSDPAAAEGGGERAPGASVFPKVIITTRTELLARGEAYEHAFFPVEPDDNSEASRAAAEKSFLELRLAPFDEQVNEYIHAKVALEVRQKLGKQFGAFQPLSKQAAEKLEEDVKSKKQAAKELEEGVKSKFNMLVHAACQAVTSPSEVSNVEDGDAQHVEQVLASVRAEVAHEGQGHEAKLLSFVLAAALLQPPPDLNKAMQEFSEKLTKEGAAQQVWLFQDYRDAFDAIPELKELTTTPFMVQIVTEILPKLREKQGTDALMKAKLLLLLEEDAAQTVWGCINRWRGRHPEDAALQQVRIALDSNTAEKEGAASLGLAALAELAKEVTELLRAKGMLLKQPKLAEIAREQVEAKRKAGGDMEHATWSRLGAGWRAACALGSTAASMPGDQEAADVGNAETLGQNSGVPEDGAVNAMVEAVLDDLLQHAEDEAEYEDAVEDTICSAGIPYMLKSALQRTKVRRSDIYAMFTARYVEREARKAVGRGTVDGATVEREGKEYAQRLALTMVSENVSKVPMASSSELFHEESVWDPFLLGGGELRAAAQKAAPVKCDGGVLTFIHKTVQEYLCAASLHTAFRAALSDLTVPLEQLEEHLQSAAEPAAPASTGGAGAGEGLKPSEGTDAGALSTQPGTRTAAPGAGGLSEAPQKHQSGGTRAAKALRRVAERLLKSGWAQVDLRDEDVVRDFLTDLFLDDVEFAAEISFVVGWSQQHFDSAGQAGKDVYRADLLRGNVSAVLGGALPKRAGGTLLHAAAADGSYFAVARILEMWKKGHAPHGLLEQRDDEGRTPLFCAAQSGHVQVAAALLAAGARRDARSNLRPQLRGLSVMHSALIDGRSHSVKTDQSAFDHWVVGVPAAAPVGGRWRFEVKLELQRHSHWDSSPVEARYIGVGYSIGWSTGDVKRAAWSDVPRYMKYLEWEGIPSDQWKEAFAKQGHHVGLNRWSFGLHSSGAWRSLSMPPLASAGGGGSSADPPVLSDEASLGSGHLSIGMLLDCDQQMVYVAVGRDSDWRGVAQNWDAKRAPVFPALSCYGFIGEGAGADLSHAAKNGRTPAHEAA